MVTLEIVKVSVVRDGSVRIFGGPVVLSPKIGLHEASPQMTNANARLFILPRFRIRFDYNLGEKLYYVTIIWKYAHRPIAKRRDVVTKGINVSQS